MKKIDYFIPLYKDSLYHIYNRGNGKENIFFEAKNYFYFLKQYSEYLNDILDTFAYCLLPNHFHLLVRPKINDPDLVIENFRRFFISYSMSINKQQNRKGNLFQRAFKRKIIDSEKYFYAAVYYIHSNPVHHNLTEDITEYNYSSYNSLIGSKETKLCRNEVLEWFGGKSNFVKFHTEIKQKYFDDNYVVEDE